MMIPDSIAASYSEHNGAALAAQYLKTEDIYDLIWTDGEGDRLPPVDQDLARLHSVIRTRRLFTVLEFGLGYSTIVMADALLKNRADWEALRQKPLFRNSAPFQLHSVDASESWIQRTERMLPDHLRDVVRIHHSPISAGTFQDRVCHFYNEVPDVVPDLIYLDGPDPGDVKGAIGGLSWQCTDRVVMGGDILRMEPHLLPGTIVVVDGRTANARFLAAHLYRNWLISYDPVGDVTVMELDEAPLGRINAETLAYCRAATA